MWVVVRRLRVGVRIRVRGWRGDRDDHTGIGLRKVLATAKGTPLYLFTGDPAGGSKCVGACAKQWEPLTVSGKPTAGSGANAEMLSTFKRSDGHTQVLYNGHALYTHSSTASAGSVAGTASDGGIWYLVSPAGKAITHTNSGGY